MRLLAVTLTLLLAAGCSAGTAESGAPPADPGYGAAEERTGEIDTDRDSQSTFALDVDTASYTYAARQLADGNWPDRSAIRPEEFINSFDQHYPQPRGDGFALHVDGAHLPQGRDPQERLLRVGLQTRAEDLALRPDVALTFVIDVSGSMREPGRLDLVQDALHYLVDGLGSSDAVAIVTFNDHASVVREMTRASDRDVLHRAIDSLSARGSTNLGDGLITGYEVARDGFRASRSNRVILLSDGLANRGETEADRILRVVAEEAGKEIALLGVGVGSDYGDQLMERLADRGDGFVVYVSERSQARELFVKRLPAALSVRAYDAKAQVEFDPDQVASYRLVGYDNRLLADDEFRDDRVDGGEIGPGHSVTALYVLRLRPGAQGRIAQVRVRWLDPKTRKPSEVYESIRAADVQADFAGADARLRVCYVAAQFALALRDSDAAIDLSTLARITDDALWDLGNDAKGTELLQLIRRADRISAR